MSRVAGAHFSRSVPVCCNPRFDVAHFSLAVLLLDGGRSDEAEVQFKAVVDLDPGSYEAAYYLGNIAYGRKAFDADRRMLVRGLAGVRIGDAETRLSTRALAAYWSFQWIGTKTEPIACRGESRARTRMA